MSQTIQIFSLVQTLRSSGRTITSLCVGEPDYSPPPSILDATHQAITNGHTRYTSNTGTLELRQCISQDLKRRTNVSYDAVNDIVVTNGAKQGIYEAMLALCGVGDEVIVPAPYWPSYPEMVRLVGASPVILDTEEKDGYLIDASKLRKVLEQHSKVKMLILCNPSNPTGAVHTRLVLEELCGVLEDFPNVVILADEIYDRLLYLNNDDDDHYVSFASLPNMYHRTITINGFSKTFAMTGYRLGYVAAPSYYASAIDVIQSQLTSCASSISQKAGVAALDPALDGEIEKNVQIMKERRDFVVGELRDMSEHVKVSVVPRGAFYVLPDVSYYMGGDDVEFCMELLKKKGVALVPGSGFGKGGTVRVSYATSMEDLKVAMDKLREFVMELEQ